MPTPKRNSIQQREHRRDFDNSMMQTFCTCPRKYDYRINRGFVKKVKATAPEFGKAIHKGLDVWFAGQDVQKAIEAFKESYQEDLSLDDKRTYVMGEWILENYAQKYQAQPWKVLKTEHAFCLPLPNGNNLTGRIDKIIEWDNVLWVVDHKTTSSLGARYTKQAEPNAQFTGYVWAARQEGFDVKGIIVDALLVAKGLLESSSRARLVPNLRYDSYRSEAIIEEWLLTAQEVQAHIRACEYIGVWPATGMFHGACTYFGECPFYQVCKEDAEVRERILKASYEIDFWDPRDED